jgi:hypothetical protein
MIEDTSLKDFADAMEKERNSLRSRLLPLRARVRHLQLALICALTEHKPKEWGAKYWTDCGYEYDGGIKCTRCEKELT